MLNNDIKSELNAGLSKVIGSLFETIVQPLLAITITPLFNVILELGHRIVTKRERNMQAKMETTQMMGDLFANVLDENKLDCLIFTLHNGVKSKENKKIHGKYITCIFNNIEDTCQSPYIEKMTHTTLLATSYRKGISNCIQKTLGIQEDFDVQAKYYFEKYKQIYFTYFRGAYIFYLYKVVQNVNHNTIAQFEMLMKDIKLN